MRRSRLSGLGGWILLEVLIALAVLSLIVRPMGDLVVQMIRGSRGAAVRLSQETALATAEAAVLQLTREGLTPLEISRELAPRFPKVRFVIDGPICRAIPVDDVSRAPEASR
jgi:type II secretory pathway pseudopilin PulG